MIRRPPRSTQSRSSAASDVYKRKDDHKQEVRCTGEESDDEEVSATKALAEEESAGAVLLYAPALCNPKTTFHLRDVRFLFRSQHPDGPGHPRRRALRRGRGGSTGPLPHYFRGPLPQHRAAHLPAMRRGATPAQRRSTCLRPLRTATP